MNNGIITKFTIATEQGINTLLYLTQNIAREKYTGRISEKELDAYIADSYNTNALLNEVNSMSNQWLVVYAGEQAAGFARITSKGERPTALAQQRAVRIADFGALKKFTDPAIIQSLFAKCW